MANAALLLSGRPCAPSAGLGSPAPSTRRARATPQAAAGQHRAASLRVACVANDAGGEGPAGADDWIARWKVRRDSTDEATTSGPRARLRGPPPGPDPRTAFHYVFAGGWSPDAHGFTALILRDTLESRGVELHSLSSSPQSPGQPWTLTEALAAFEASVSSLPKDRPLRLIGASVGALLCALYAERHPGLVDSLFLMSPVRGQLLLPASPREADAQLPAGRN